MSVAGSVGSQFIILASPQICSDVAILLDIQLAAALEEEEEEVD